MATPYFPAHVSSYGVLVTARHRVNVLTEGVFYNNFNSDNMELTKPIYEALLRLETFEQLQGFLRVATIKGTKQSKFRIYDYTASGELHPTINGVYHDPEAQKAVATDAHVLIVSGADYKEELAGQIIGKTGNMIDGNFPNWRAVVPRKEDCFEVQPFTISTEIVDMMAKFKAEHKKVCKNAKEHAKKFKAYIKHRFEDNKGEPTTLVFEYDNLRKFITANTYLETLCFEFRPPRQSSTFPNAPHFYPIVGRRGNGDTAICMPFTPGSLVSLEKYNAIAATTHTEFDGDIDKPFIAFINDLD